MSTGYTPFPTMDMPKVPYQKVDQQNVPRCSLDFRIFLKSGHIIEDSQLRLQSFQGQEHINQPFEFSLTLRANDYTAGARPPEFVNNQLQVATSQSAQAYGSLLEPGNPQTGELDFASVLGANATILLGTPETDVDVDKGNYPATRPVVYFNGIISNFALSERGAYQATLKPELFKLSLQNKYRVFSNSTILDVVKAVLDENSINYNKAALESNQPKVVCGLAQYRKQDWLQAGESDLDFITRLMSKVNLFYYFVHDETSHTMVITDQPYYRSIYHREVNAQGQFAETDQLKPLYLSFTQQASADRDDYIHQFTYQQNLTTSGVTTILAQKESVWESQNTAQVSPIYQQREYQQPSLNMSHMHTVQYGASWEEADKMTTTAINKINAAKHSFSGGSGCPELKAGHKFKVLETWDMTSQRGFSTSLPVRPELNDLDFVVTSVSHQAKAEGDYSNQFSAVIASGLPIGVDPHGVAQGSILARVTAKPAVTSSSASLSGLDDETTSEVDHTGSAAIQLEKSVFTFDSNQFQFQIDETDTPFACTGVYVRFIDQPEDASPVWVKLAEHMQTVPEVGVYVVVSRSSDENEIPEIQQILQAKGNKVIMPKGYTCSTNVGDNYGTSYGDSTSIGFGADITTPLSTAQNIVNTQRATGHYNDVRYGESTSYGYNVTARSHNISLTGSGTPPAFDPPGMLDYVAYSHSVTNGDSYHQSETTGDSTQKSVTIGNTTSDSQLTGNTTSTNTTVGNSSHTSSTTGNTTSVNDQTGNTSSSNTTNGDTSSTNKQYGTISSSNVHEGMNNSSSTHSGMANSANNMNGMTNSASNTNGMTSSINNFNGVNNSVNVMLGMENSASTKTGVFLTAQNINGIQNTTSLITGSSSDTTTITGSKTTITTIGGILVENKTTTAETIMEESANSARQQTILNWAENQMIASKSGANTTATDNTVKTTQADNSVESTTAKNKVSNVSAGTTTSNDSSLITENKVQHTELVSATKVVL